MVRIRLKRMGRRNLPFYRVNAVEKKTQRDGKILENLGWYDPLCKDESKQYLLDSERIKHWMSVGAQPSDTVKDLMVRAGLYDADKRKAEYAARFSRKIEAQKVAAKAQAEAEAAAAAAKAKADAEAAAAAAAKAKADAAAAAAAPAEGGEEAKA